MFCYQFLFIEKVNPLWNALLLAQNTILPAWAISKGTVTNQRRQLKYIYTVPKIIL
jgi:hypothetical protein